MGLAPEAFSGAAVATLSDAAPINSLSFNRYAEWPRCGCAAGGR